MERKKQRRKRRAFTPDFKTKAVRFEQRRVVMIVCTLRLLTSPGARSELPRISWTPARRVSSGIVHGIEDQTKAEEARGRVQA